MFIRTLLLGAVLLALAACASPYIQMDRNGAPTTRQAAEAAQIMGTFQ